MNSIELEELLSSVETFKGVWASDRLRFFEFAPGSRASIIVNIQPRWMSGLHWVVFAWDGENLQYFDSSGIPPVWHPCFNGFILKHGGYKRCRINTRLIQSPDSDLCGQYCALFVCVFDSGWNIDTFIQCFTASPKVNGKIIAAV